MNYMLTSNEIVIANEWEKYKGFTVRPVNSTVQYYLALIKQLSEKTDFFVYGGTPEIRSIFQTLHLNITIADLSETVVRAMGTLTHHKLPLSHNESFIKTNWLSLDMKNKYDLLMGDDAINMIPWIDFDEFLQRAANILKEDGQFICHLLVKPDDTLIKKRFLDVLYEYIEGHIKSPFDLASRLNFICYDHKNYLMGWQQTIEILGEKQLNILKPYFDFFNTFKLCNSQFYCPPQLEFEKKLTKYFKINEIFYPHEHDYCMFEPVYYLTKI